VNNKQILEAEAAASPYSQAFTDVDGSPAMVVQCVPDNGDSITAATLQVVTATGLTILINGAAPAGTNAIGASGVVAFATYTTLGAVRDALNSTRVYRAYLVGGLRADTSASKLLTASAASILGDTGLTIYHDASSTDHFSFAISGERFVNNGVNGHITDAIGKNGGYRNSLLAANINMGITGASPQIQFHFEKQQGTTVQASVTRVMVDDTLEEIGTENPMIPYLTAPIGYRLVGRVSVATTVDDIATFDVLGKSADLTGAYHVTEKNW
jgi:hypothetical protein